MENGKGGISGEHKGNPNGLENGKMVPKEGLNGSSTESHVVGQETIVTLRQSKNGCFLTKTKAVIGVIGVVLCLVLVVLLLTFVGKAQQKTQAAPTGSSLCPCKDNKINLTMIQAYTSDDVRDNSTLIAENLTLYDNNSNSNSSNSTNEAISVSHRLRYLQHGKGPWQNIRLTRSVLPVHYDLFLKIDLENTTFYGMVNITLNITGPVKTINLHVYMLYVDLNRVHVYEYTNQNYMPRHHNHNNHNIRNNNNILMNNFENINNNNNFDDVTRRPVNITRKFFYRPNQFLVLEMEDMLQPTINSDRKYVIEIGYFRGMILKDLKGLYLSTYEKGGTTR